MLWGPGAPLIISTVCLHLIFPENEEKKSMISLSTNCYLPIYCFYCHIKNNSVIVFPH